MSWVTLDRINREEARADETIRRMVEGSGRPLRSHAEHLTDEELLEKLHGFGLDLDRGSLEKLCQGALSAEEVARHACTTSPVATCRSCGKAPARRPYVKDIA